MPGPECRTHLEGHGEASGANGPLVALDGGDDIGEGSLSGSVSSTRDLHLADDIGEVAGALGVGALLELVLTTGGDGDSHGLDGAVGLTVGGGGSDRSTSGVGHDTGVHILRSTHSTAATTRHFLSCL